MELFDTHCHLDFEPLYRVSDPQVLQHTLELAQSESVGGIVVPAVTESRWANVIEVCRVSHPVNRYPALGLHPCFLRDHTQEHLQLLERALDKNPAVKAVGETGLDLFIENPEFERQLYFFNQQVELAKQFDLPLLIHGRRSVDQIIKVLRHSKPPAGGVLHAFSGSEQQASQLWDLGFSIGLGGALTYERAQRLRRVAKSVPLDSILLETDAPDMPVQGFQGEPNWPHRVGYAARTLATLRGVSIEWIAEQTTHNAKKLFRV